MVPTPTAIMNGVALRRTLVRTVMSSATTSSGRVPTQYFDQRSARRSSGELRSSHICRPSRLTAGKMKRAAMDASTKPARPRLRNETTDTRKNGTCSPRNNGSALMLNR